MNLSFSTTSPNTRAEFKGIPRQDEVVELGLLLSATRAEALVALAKRRNSSVAQVLRGLIDNALASESHN